MSTKILNLAWDVDLPLSRKMVFIALADQANDYGESYPGVESLQKRCSMGLRTVYEAIASLEAEGWLERRQLPGKKTLYCLNVERLRQQDLLAASPAKPGRSGGSGAGGAASAGVQGSQGCATRRGAPSAGVRDSQGCGNRNQGGAAAAPIKATKSKATTEEEDVRARAASDDPELVQRRYAEYEAMDRFDRECVDPYLDQLPIELPLPRWVEFVKHRRAMRRPLSLSAFQMLLQDFARLQREGVDLSESLRVTMLGSWVIPVNPKRASSGRGPPRPRANDDLSTVSYEGTPLDELPPELECDT